MMRPMRRLVPFFAACLALLAALTPAAAGAALPAVVHLPKGTEAEALAVGPESECGSRAAAAQLAGQGKLPVRLVARIGGKVSARRTAVLRAGK
jgi:hypothetical protein